MKKVKEILLKLKVKDFSWAKLNIRQAVYVNGIIKIFVWIKLILDI